MQTAAIGAATTVLAPKFAAGQSPSASVRPVVIASANGLAATAKAAQMILGGADPLDAVIAGVNIVEADPNDHSVGLGGLPNEDGVVELDSSVMHGPTHKAGAVAALRNIVHPSQVARLVMQRTDHCLIVGEGAQRFARAHGFKEQDLLTEEARKKWLKWKESHSDNDDWIAPEDNGDNPRSRRHTHFDFTYGTINCCAVNANGDLAGVTTTSGLSYKIPGRVGDSPIIGAGLYVDNEIGAAGSTGRGESVMVNCGSFAIVELMRAGRHPKDACLEVLQRVCDHTREKRLLDDNGRPNFQLHFYAINKDGQYGSAAIWSSPSQGFAIFENGQNRHEPATYLFEKSE